MRALVTGAAGFIGSHICRRLVADGTRGPRARRSLRGHARQPRRRRPRRRSSRPTFATRQRVIRAADGVDVIFHQGAKRSVPRSLADPFLTTDVNVRGTLNVLGPPAPPARASCTPPRPAVYGDQTDVPAARGHVPPRRSRRTPQASSPYEASPRVHRRQLRHAYRRPCGTSTYTGRGRTPQRVRGRRAALHRGLSHSAVAPWSTATATSPATSPTSTTSSRRTSVGRVRRRTPTDRPSTSAGVVSPRR